MSPVGRVLRVTYDVGRGVSGPRATSYANGKKRFSCKMQRGNVERRNNHCNGYRSFISAAAASIFCAAEDVDQGGGFVLSFSIFSKYHGLTCYLDKYLMEFCQVMFRASAGQFL